jgi:hypothetical protein
MAALQILDQAGSRRPVVACVDDALWLDRASVQVLAFMARRLENDPIVLLAAVRTGYQTPIENAGIRARPGVRSSVKGRTRIRPGVSIIGPHPDDRATGRTLDRFFTVREACTLPRSTG